jgi:hypothetical protein
MFLGAGVSAYATSVDFTFDAQTINGQNIAGLSAGATAAQIQTYMNAVLTAAGCSGCSAVVYTGGSSGAVADQQYNADGYVVGPGGKSLTLGTSQGATSNSNTASENANFGTTGVSYDTFIANTSDSGGTNNGSSGVTSQITIQFKGITGLTVTSFNYEIFPDINCTALDNVHCGGTGNPDLPDLKFEAGTGTTGSDAVVSSFGTSGVQDGLTPSASGSDGTSTTGPNGTITAPQYIGTWSGSLTGDTELDFVDWPATIGIDNLNISYTTPVPEPASIALFGTLVFLLTRKLRKV